MGNFPSNIADQAGRFMSLLNDLVYDRQHFVVGGAISDGGTTQGSGAGTALNFDVDVAELDGYSVSGVERVALAAAADVDNDAGIAFGATSGVSVDYAVVVQTGAANDTAPAYFALAGTPATTGQQVPPTRDEIAAALGHSNFSIVGDVTVNRTADTTVTLAFSYARRSRLGTAVQLATEIRPAG